MTIARQLPAPLLALVVLAGCAGARPPEAPPAAEAAPEPAPAPAPTPPAPPPEPDGRELTSPVEDGEAGVLEGETRAAIRETEERLAALGEDASQERREAVAAIRSLLEQSRSALAGGELERAHNLARKARELAGEL